MRRHRPGPSPAAIGFLLLAAAAVVYGSSAGAVRVFLERTGTSGAVAAFAQSVIAAPILLAAGAASRAPWPSVRVAAPAAFVTGGLVSGFLVSYFTSIGLVGVTIASVVAICSAPLFTALLAVGILRERPTQGMLVALVVGIAGTALVLIAQGAGDAAGEGRVAGVLLALLAGACFGGENVAVRHFVRRFDPTRLAAFMTCAMVVLLAPLALAHGGVLRASSEAWPWLLYLAVFPTALAPAMHNAGLHRVPAIPASIVGLIEPLTAAGIGLVIFHEAIGPLGAVGAVLLVVALGVLVRTQRGSELEAPAPASERAA